MKEIIANLMVEDVDATLLWYKTVFAAEMVAAVPYTADDTRFQWAMIGLGKAQLMFQLRASLEEELPILAGKKLGGSFSLYIKTEAVSSLHDALQGKVEILEPLHETFYGSHEFAIKDCNGYVLVFAE
ncbi:bleomycin resistance family protein [Candidatus Gracilibacteria bacterium]|nr:bleomycin resistance family protein [Candidatus Gracilibacteria bacterium]